jgi:guanylate kinase
MPTDLLVLIGPSGVGKSSVARALHRAGAVTIRPTWTTRPPRPGELQRSLDHCFVDDIEFGRLVAHGYFQAIGSHPGQRYQYGLPHRDPDADRLELVVLRASHVRCVSGEHTVVYQLDAPAAIAAARLRRRGDRADDIALRLAAHDAELDFGASLADRTFRTERALPVVVAEILAALRQDTQLAIGGLR